jgi:hypothetical protein
MTLELRYAHVDMHIGEDGLEGGAVTTGAFSVGAPVRDVPAWLAKLALMPCAVREKHTPGCVREQMQVLLDLQDGDWDFMGKVSKATVFARYDGSDASLSTVDALAQELGERSYYGISCPNIVWSLTRTSLFFDFEW